MATWVTDGSDGCTINGLTLTFRRQSNSDIGPCNAIWQEGNGVSSGRHYWKIHLPILEGTACIGLTSMDHFKKGYACRGIIYSGELRNGDKNGDGRLVSGKFGPDPKQSDTIGILAAFEGIRLKVYIDVNGKSLGEAFDVPASYFESIFPLVSIADYGSATCTKETEIPNITTRAPTTFTGIEGYWALVKLNDEVLPPPDTNQFTHRAKIEKRDQNNYEWNIDTNRANLVNNHGIWMTHGVISKGKGKAPLKYEVFLKNLMDQVSKVEVDTDGQLSVISPITSTKWVRYTYVPNSFFGSPFIVRPSTSSTSSTS